MVSKHIPAHGTSNDMLYRLLKYVRILKDFVERMY